MTIIWIAIGLATLVAGTLLFQWRERNQAEAVKQYVLETTELERQLALMNPRLARGIRLEPSEQAWLEKMLYERRITRDPTKWASPDLGYDAVSGSLAEFLTTYSASGGSSELMKIKSEQVRIEKMQRMIADIGMPESQDQIDKWFAEHSGDAERLPHDPVLPGQHIYHAAVIREQSSSRGHDATAEFERRHQRGLDAGQKTADAVEKMMERLVMPWANSMIDTFTKKVAVKLIFCDEAPEQAARVSLAEFNQAADDHLGQIRPDVRAKLSTYEQPSGELAALLTNRFDAFRQNLIASATEIAQCVVTARNEEMGFEVAKGERLVNGRRILKETRATPLSLTEDQKKTMLEALDLVAAHGKTA